METMVERVAKAIACEIERAEAVPDDIAFAYLGTAHAAIEAMRPDLDFVVEIAGRNEGAPEIDRLRSALSEQSQKVVGDE